jgi:hypothetical protein
MTKVEYQLNLPFLATDGVLLALPDEGISLVGIGRYQGCEA